MLTQSEQPLVTVLLPVYNGQRYLREAIESVLCQTLTDFELLIVDDGSTDGSADLVREFTDPRIRLVVQADNNGISEALNHGVTLAQGIYIARMDADDICRPERLRRQVDFLQQNLDVAVCGTWMEAFDGASREIWGAPCSHDEILARMLFASALYHPTVCMRKTFLIENHLSYSNDFPNAEDYELWLRSAKFGQLANIAEVLLDYRIHEGQVGQKTLDVRQDCVDRIRLKVLQELGLQPDPKTLGLHRCISLGEVSGKSDFVSRVERWLLSVREYNLDSGWIPDYAMSHELAVRWLHTCVRSTAGISTVTRFVRSPLFRFVQKRWQATLVMVCRAVLCRRG